ncbi:hypothetical protein P029_02190 [Anaplasma phagocytophilum str. Norway variant2]|uniref:Surface antigen family protein n=1 Tax=Anaplasma phagocytophilum str. Norway variant2 TaxID=1392507 RepID=A0A161I5Q4_ANAPH|nr:hypothetical protein [Anaplasma phagocytophilum]ANC34193.1 hypothetical protein P029_02190 [Anaplasma phagocytophilum str. Norway variant2]
MLDFSHMSVALPYLRALTPVEYNIGYTRNVAFSDPFNVGYKSQMANWSFTASMLWPIFNGKYYHEFELHSAKATPSLSVDTQHGFSIIKVMRNVYGIHDLSASSVENMLTIRSTAASYGFYRYHPINESFSLYVGTGMGIAKILQYQGFRRHSEDLFGVVKNFRLGIVHKFSSGLSAYVGYTYRITSWKYKSDTIYDQDGNSITYDLQNFEFSTHGLDLGVRFSM